MPDAVNPDDLGAVVNFIQNAVQTNSDSPIVLAANQFPAAARTRLAGQLLDRANDPRTNDRG